MQLVEMNYSKVDKMYDLSALHTAALVDENGREIPITEEMILSACDALMQLWQFPVSKAA